jgi:hypothetical protein
MAKRSSARHLLFWGLWRRFLPEQTCFTARFCQIRRRIIRRKLTSWREEFCAVAEYDQIWRLDKWMTGVLLVIRGLFVDDRTIL